MTFRTPMRTLRMIDLLASVPGLDEHVDGWKPAGFQVLETGGDYLIALLLASPTIPRP